MGEAESKSVWKKFAISRDAPRENNVVIAKLVAMYLLRPFLKGAGVSKKADKP